MRNLTLTSSFIAALSLTSFGQTDASLHSKISNKEKQLAEIQKELHELRSKLNNLERTLEKLTEVRDYDDVFEDRPIEAARHGEGRFIEEF